MTTLTGKEMVSRRDIINEFPFEINIPRPYPKTNENEIIIKYIEPLREAGLVKVSSAYHFNLQQYMQGEECSYSDGFKYMFWFKTELERDKFEQNILILWNKKG